VRFLPIVLLFLLVFEMPGCKSIQGGDLTGAWVMKDASRQVLPTELQKASAKLVLDANGTFVASELPEELPLVAPYDVKNRNVRLDTGSGVWKIVSREGKQQVQLDFHTMAGSKEGGVPYGTQMDVSRGWSAVSLYYFLGDADEGRRVSFERK
jgi:hypothetical protein